jgi:hypothetical protein
MQKQQYLLNEKLLQQFKVQRERQMEEQWWHLSPPSEPGNKLMDSSNSNLGIVQPQQHSNPNPKRPSLIPQMRSLSGQRARVSDVPFCSTNLEQEVVKCSVESAVESSRNGQAGQQQQQRASRSNKRHDGRYTSGNVFIFCFSFAFYLLGSCH